MIVKQLTRNMFVANGEGPRIIIYHPSLLILHGFVVTLEQLGFYYT